MARNAWQRLIERYADGRTICNCNNAYCKPCGIGWVKGERRTDLMACFGGCQANQFGVKFEIAERVEAEMASEGDAKLISAAPDLYTALSDLIEYEPSFEMHARARAALAKARGEKSS